MKVDMIDKSLNTPINSEDEDYIMRKSEKIICLIQRLQSS